MISVDDFKDDDVIIIQGNSGISISQSKHRFLLFKRENVSGSPPWKIIAELPVDKIRGVEKVDSSVERSLEVNVRVGGGLSGAARGIGEGVGGALRDAVDARRAKRETGLLFDLDWFDEPAFFVNIPDQKTRNQAIVCLRQIFEGRAPEGSVREIDHKVELSFPNQEMLDGIAEKAATSAIIIKRFYLFASVIILGIFGVFGYIEIDKSITRNNNKALLAYRATLFQEPSSLVSAQGNACEILRKGYNLAIEGGGPQATHIYDSWSVPGSDAFQFHGVADCYYAYVAVNADQNSVSITGKGSCVVNGISPSTPTPLAPEDMRFFAPLTEPTC